MDREQQELLLGFVEEGREMIDEVEPLLVELEHHSDQMGEIEPEVINTIFRLFHSLKGGAGFLDLSTISRVTHEAETLLDKFRKGEACLESKHIDLLTRSCDFLRQLLESIEKHLTDDGFEEQADDLIESLSFALNDLNRDSAGSKVGITTSESNVRKNPELTGCISPPPPYRSFKTDRN